MDAWVELEYSRHFKLGGFGALLLRLKMVWAVIRSQRVLVTALNAQNQMLTMDLNMSETWTRSAVVHSVDQHLKEKLEATRGN